jgi:hypothetical protein
MLRQELRRALGSMEVALHTDSAPALQAHRANASAAELSCVRQLLALCADAFTGDAILDDDCRFRSIGAIRDAQDAASFAARELMVLREAAEQDASPPAPLAALVLAEDRATRIVQQREEAHAALMSAALETCAMELCDLVCRALQAAEGHADKAQLGRLAQARALRIVQHWLLWFDNANARAPRPEPVRVPDDLVRAAAHDARLAQQLRDFRRCMHLRRQQARLLHVMRRLAAAARAADACALLRARIDFSFED